LEGTVGFEPVRLLEQRGWSPWLPTASRNSHQKPRTSWSPSWRAWRWSRPLPRSWSCFPDNAKEYFKDPQAALSPVVSSSELEWLTLDTVVNYDAKEVAPCYLG
jgi:hypothetical protein